ncbi:dienelactone hydrolase family protein [Streptomyces sp. 4N509B]|uniref:dienelactone hydrolase family protein n=1 Tax=Streptomyces sp. 4N509B TaxID=3457413 RepID=UPI003FCF32FC
MPIPGYHRKAASAVTDLILFHSMYGLRPAVHEAAERLRAAGHRVVVPDLFDGRTARTVEEGLAIKDEFGQEELLRRAVAAAAPHSDAGLVYAGFSLGASFAQTIALGDERARGLLMLHGTADLADDATADELPVQLHVADPDPFEPHDWQTAWYLRMRKAGADVEVFRYAGAGHLYTDPELPDHDAEAAERTWPVVLDFLAEIDAGAGTGDAPATPPAD